MQRTKTKLCLQNKVCLFLLWDTFPATRHKPLCQSRFPNRQITASSLEHYLVFVFRFYLIKRRKPSSEPEDRGSKIYKETARQRVLAFTFTCPHVSSKFVAIETRATIRTRSVVTVVFTGMSPCLTLVYICVTKRLINHSCKTRKTAGPLKQLIKVTLGCLSAGMGSQSGSHSIYGSYTIV